MFALISIEQLSVEATLKPQRNANNLRGGLLKLDGTQFIAFATAGASMMAINSASECPILFHKSSFLVLASSQSKDGAAPP